MARKFPEIPSASMADIAFMLLIFFLVATTMDMDRGLSRRLPPIPVDTEDTTIIDIHRRNAFVVLINKHDQLLVNGDYMQLGILREKTKEFVLNTANKKSLPEKESLSFLKEKSLKKEDIKGANKFQFAIDILGEDYQRSKGIVSLQNDRGTSYKIYIEVQNELVAAFNELRDEYSMRKFSKEYEDLTEEQQTAIKTAIPQAISEAEPKNIK